MVCTVEEIHPALKPKRDLVKYVTPLRDIDEILNCNNFAERYGQERSFSLSQSQIN
jgi:hypothetical protein